MNNQQKNVIKLVYKHFDNGEILPGRYAEQLDDETFRIVRPDKTTMDVKINETIPKVGKVLLDHNNNLTIGKFTILAGMDPYDPHEELKAEPTQSKKKFKLTTYDLVNGEKKAKTRDVALDDNIPSFGVLKQDKHGRLHINDRTVAVFSKQYELNVICLAIEAENGRRAFFNKLMPKDPENRKNGIPGIFKIGQDGKPSIFTEKGVDGQTYTTAQFKANDDGRTMTVKMRSLASAIEDRYICAELERIKTEEADYYEEHPSELQEYSDLRDKLVELRATCFTMMDFGVINGHRLLNLPRSPAPQSSLEPS
jgi:hypothetical protein